MFGEIGDGTLRELAAHAPLYRHWMTPRLRSGEVIALVVDWPGLGVVASGCIWFRPEQPRPTAPRTTVPYVFSMYTDPEYRRRGLARRIVREVLKICRDQRYSRVVLHAARPARRLYKSLGFERSWEMRATLD